MSRVQSREPRDAGSGWFRCCAPVVCLGAALLALSVIVCTLRHVPGFHRLYAEWHIWLTLLQLAGVLVLAWRRLLSGRRDWAEFAAVNLLLAAVNWFCLLQQFDAVLLRSAELLLRLGIVAIWTVPVFGLLWLMKRRLWKAIGDRQQAIPLASCHLPATHHSPLPARHSHTARWAFSTAVVLVLLEPSAALIERRRDRLPFPSQLAEPAPDEFRIVTLGGSTMLGYPYEPKYGIGQVMQQQLQRADPQRRVVVENLAVAGQNLHQSICQLARLKVRPHLLVLYSGHNEFFHELEELGQASRSLTPRLDQYLGFSPTFRLFNEQLSQRLALRELTQAPQRWLSDHPVAPPSVSQRRISRFRGQLQQLATFCGERKIASLWFVPAGAESVYEPNRSWVSTSLSDAQFRELDRLYRAGRSAQDAEDWETAAGQFQALLQRFPGVAEFHFQAGECLSSLDRSDEAQKQYALALECDGHPVRCTAKYRRQVGDVARAFRIPVVDAAETLRPHTPHGILDRTFFHDNVHPTLYGHYLLGTAAAKAVGCPEGAGECREPVMEGGQLRPLPTAHCPLPAIGFAESIATAGIRRSDLAEGYRHMAQTLTWLGRFRFDDSRRRLEAGQYLALANRLDLAKRAADGDSPHSPAGENSLEYPLAADRPDEIEQFFLSGIKSRNRDADQRFIVVGR